MQIYRYICGHFIKEQMKTKITERDYIKANRKASREEEIERYGHPLPKSRVYKSKKAYDRNKTKAALKRQPFDFSMPQLRVMIRAFVCCLLAAR